MNSIRNALLLFTLLNVGAAPAQGLSYEVFARPGEPVLGAPGATYGSVSTTNPPVLTNSGEAFWFGRYGDNTQYVASTKAGVVLEAGLELSPGVEVGVIFDIGASKHGGDTVAQVLLSGAGVTPAVNDLAILRSSSADNWQWEQLLRSGDTRGGDTLTSFATPLVQGDTLAINGFATGPGGPGEQFVLIPATDTTPERYLSTSPPPSADSDGEDDIIVGVFAAFIGGVRFDGPLQKKFVGLVRQVGNEGAVTDAMALLYPSDGLIEPLIAAGDPTNSPGLAVGDFLSRFTIDKTENFLTYSSSNSTTDERYLGTTPLSVPAPATAVFAENSTTERVLRYTGPVDNKFYVTLQVLDAQGVPIRTVVRDYDLNDPDLPDIGTVAQDGDAIDGAVFETFANSPQLISNGVGQAVVPALDGATCAGFTCDQALYLFERGGDARVALREGDVIDLDDDPETEDLRTIDRFEFFNDGAGEGGHGVSLNDSGQIGVPVQLEGGGTVFLIVDTWEVPLPGDYTDDGVVDAADYTFARDRFGQPAGALPHNNLDDGPIGPDHLATWRVYYGVSLPQGGAGDPAAVPEPAPIGLLAIALACASGVRRLCQPSPGSTDSPPPRRK